MTRTFYSYAIFFSCLYIVTTLIQSIAYFLLGGRMIELSSIREWMIFSTAIDVVWSLILLKYYHARQYTVAFTTLMITVTATLIHVVIYYRVLSTHELSVLFFFGIMLVILSGLTHGLALIFSKASERAWLKNAGVLSVVLQLVMLASIVWAMVSISARLNGSIDKVHAWLGLIGSFLPVFFIVNFLHERKTERKEKGINDYSNELAGFASMAACIALLIFAPRFGMEARKLASDPTHMAEWKKAPASKFDERYYLNSRSEKLPYRLLKPLGYDSTKQYPLVVCLHGSSGCGTDNTKQILSSIHAYLLSQDSMRTRYPAFVLVPQCPIGYTWGGIANVPSVDSLLVETIVALQTEFPIDAKRLYVMGNSLGGYGAWHLACTRPGMFAAAVPICGGGDPALAKKLVNVPVWAFHGAKDMNVPVSGSREMIEAIRNAGGDPKYSEYPEEAHDITRNVIETHELLDWMFARRRD